VGVPGGALALAALLTGSATAQASRQPRPAAVTAAPAPACRVPSGGTVLLRLAGVDRLARVHVPAGLAAQHDLPLVVNLHGTGSTAAGQESTSRMDAVADRYGFLVAYPQGARRAGTGFAWNIPATPAYAAAGPDDMAFVQRLVAALRDGWCVDPTRVYVTGFSGGGRMASQLACAPDGLFAAVAPVGGLRAPAYCPGGPVPVLAVHGTADAQNPYTGHGAPYWTYDVPEAARRWAAHNGCSAAPSVRGGGVGPIVTTYRGCPGGATVQLVTLVGKGHQWPVARAGGFGADEAIWHFFREHRRHRSA
jgi:polyhydroxybutyrate depolymerase